MGNYLQNVFLKPAVSCHGVLHYQEQTVAIRRATEKGSTAVVDVTVHSDCLPFSRPRNSTGDILFNEANSYKLTEIIIATNLLFSEANIYKLNEINKVRTQGQL